MTNPVLKHCRISIPMNVPNIVPTPPVNAVPPRTAAVAASNSSPLQADGCPEFNRAASKASGHDIEFKTNHHGT